jgi:hypothetical protein
VSKLLVANDTGSAELVAPLLKLGLPAELAELEFGDVAFMGRGEGGAPLYIGIELKKLSDLVQSLTSKRLQGHQLLGLTRDFDRRYLLIEGHFHNDDKGHAVVFRGVGRPKPLKGAPQAVVLEQEIINLQTRGGLWVKETTTRRDTLRFILAAYRYWTDKDLDEHKSHLAIYAPDLDRGLFTPPSDFRKALTVILPGIGYTTSGAVERYIGETKTLREQLHRVLSMRLEDWASLEIPNGRGKVKRLGASRAQAIMGVLK